MKQIKTIFILLLSLSIFSSLNAQSSTKKKDLLFYIGITMIKPVTVLAKNFEKKHNCNIKIFQGGSQDLYDSLKMSSKGDIYLPGSVYYRNKNLKDGLLLDGKFVGYNKIAMVVKKGNPKNIKADLNELTNEKLRVVLGNERSGSIGNATKKVLEKFGNYEDAILNTIFLAPDSRNLTKSIVENNADVVLNWYATTFWKDNKNKVEPLVIDEKYAKKAKLVFNLLKSSKNVDLAKKFMQYAASKEGREIFHQYGFLDKSDLKNFDKVKF